MDLTRARLIGAQLIRARLIGARSTRVAPAGLAALGVCAVLVAGCSTGSGAGSVARPVLTVSTAACVGTAWTLPDDGRVAVTVRNTGSAPVQVDLVDAAGTAAYADVAVLAPGTARPVDARLPDGRYRWECSPVGESSAPVGHSGTVRVAASSGTPTGHLTWVTASQQQVVRSFSMALQTQLGSLLQATTELDAAVSRGDVTRARALWLTAHARYQVLGGAYGVFAELDTAVNGLADGLPGGVRDPGFTGFHRVEYLLWNGGSPADLAAASHRLLADVRTIAGRGRYLSVPLAEVTRQAHEILEQLLLVQLEGRADYGSHSALADLSAGVTGTRSLLTALAPLLAGRDPQLAALASARLDVLAARLQAVRRPDGGLPDLTALPPGRRAGLDAAVGAAVEVLAGVPVVVRVQAAGPVD